MYVKSVQEEKWEVKMLKGGTNYMDRDLVAEVNEDMLFADGFDDALVGYIERKGIEILAKDITHEEAIEYFYFNTAGAYVGENTPCFFTRIEDED